MRTQQLLRLCAALATLTATIACADNGGDGGDEMERNEDRGDFYVMHETEVSATTESAARFVQLNRLAERVVNTVNLLFAMPQDVAFWTQDCGRENAYWSQSENQIVMCNELTINFVTTFQRLAPDATDEQLTIAVVDAWIFVAFHEVGHALIDLFDLPTTGNEEDAVDAFATIILVEAGLERAAIHGALWFLGASRPEFQQTELASRHSLNQQRFYNVLCYVYGSDPVEYAAMGDTFPPMQSRLPRCEGDYNQQRNSWSRLLASWRL